MELPGPDRIELRRAKSLLEHQGLAVRIASVVGTPIERLFTKLPHGAADIVQGATTKALNAAARTAIIGMDAAPRSSTQWVHTLAAASSGAVGGAFGLATLAIELPISTVIMLRSIADIARSEGQPVASPEVQLACLEVFALGGPGRGDNAAESGYFAVRAALSRAVNEAARHLAERGLAGEAVPALVRLTSRIATRFGIPVTEKVMAQSVPILGAAGGAAINVLFIKHFQDVARGHFIVRRLEAKFGAERVRDAYLGI
ncbi:MAG TPA: EcsC family protein [Vicinamibacterales bacterium]|nr:EcsC family protein [Vicinamibacterales bacterium]